MQKFRFYAGPTQVAEVAAYMRNYFKNVVQGTEWIYLHADTAENVYICLSSKFSGYRQHDIQEAI